MGLVEVFLIGVGLSMDAFAVSVCKGLGMKRLDRGQLLVIALFFGGFQALMPLVGWLLGRQFESYIVAVDHWIAFALLFLIGGKMLWEAFFGQDEECGACEPCTACDDGGNAAGSESAPRLDLRELTMLAVATSIDALAVGITFAFLGVDIVSSAALIGVTTFVLSAVGVVLGHQFGARFEKPATIVGGVVLVLIGCKILLEHLGVIG